MDCDKALEFLDCVRPNSDDLELPDFAEARAHMEDCESCRLEFESRQEFDLAIDAIARDVEVPELLRAGLLTAALVESGGSDETAATARPDADQATDKAPSRRGRLVLGAAAVVCGIVLAVVMQFLPTGPEKFTVADLLQQVDAKSASLVAFDESFEFRFPAGWSERYAHVISTRLDGQDIDGQPGHDVARLLFLIRRGAVPGVLVAAPVNRVETPPFGLSSATVQYLPNDAASLAWTEGDMVFAVVIARDKVTMLEQLRDVLSGHAA